MIDGFPREVDQCTYFETNVCEAQNVLFFDCTQQTCVDRLLERGLTSGRSDDNAEAIAKRFETYQQKNLPVINYYEQFGKVRRIDANRDVLDIYEDTRRAMLPQISCIIGPKASGKSTLGKALCERTNMKLLNYNEFVQANSLADVDEETATSALIKQLSQEISPRMLVEDFPQSEFQAKFFIKNCVAPSRVFSLECSKDVCQERMISLAQADGSYQASAILSKKIRHYNENSARLLPYLQAATNLRAVNTEQTFATAFEQLCSYVEPTVLLVRPGGAANAYEVRQQIIEELKSTKGFVELNVFMLIKEESERHTEVGTEINEQISAGKDYQRDLDHLIVRMLKRNIYSGIEGRDKFILTDFPDTIKQAQSLEESCSKITAVIFAAGADGVVEIIENGLSMESIDSLLQKEHRLKPMRGWDEATFTEHLGNKTEWGVVIGQSLSGKTLVAGMVAEVANGKVIDLVKTAEAIRPRLATEDGEFEGRIPDAEVEKDVLAVIEADKSRGDKFLYLIDGQHHEKVEDHAAFLLNKLGCPTYLISCSADAKEIENRFKEKNEITEDLGEEDAAALKEKATAAAEDREKLFAAWADVMKRVKVINQDTAMSKESLQAAVRAQFCAKVILVNHEKRISVDTACSNLAIKYNMLYMSVYQLIRQEIAAATPLGQALLNSKRAKALDFGPVGKAEDSFDEASFSAVHFDQTLVMELMRQKIGEHRTTQRFILLEGFCNSNKLESRDARLQLRFMDEFFAIEKTIGEVVGVISLQNEKEQSTFDISPAEIQEPVQEEVKEAPPKKAEGEEGEEAEEAPAEEGEEPKVPKWDPKKFRWTVTNGRSKNLPQLFRDYMGNRCNFDEKNWKTYGAGSHGEAAVKALDEFCTKITDEGNSMTMYQQVIFNDLD